jgi:hypothetical protein
VQESSEQVRIVAAFVPVDAAQLCYTCVSTEILAPSALEK